MKTNGTMTIGRAAAKSSVPPKTIRFYEGNGLIAPAERLDNRYRSYDENDIRTLRFIQQARSLGFSLKDVGELLSLYRDRQRESKDVKRVVSVACRGARPQIAELTAITSPIWRGAVVVIIARDAPSSRNLRRPHTDRILGNAGEMILKLVPGPHIARSAAGPRAELRWRSGNDNTRRNGASRP
jgi:DNA-binding transcriptional MerR regulator